MKRRSFLKRLGITTAGDEDRKKIVRLIDEAGD